MGKRTRCENGTMIRETLGRNWSVTSILPALARFRVAVLNSWGEIDKIRPEQLHVAYGISRRDDFGAKKFDKYAARFAVSKSIIRCYDETVIKYVI